MNKGTKTLETSRLVLRKLTINDAKESFENWASDDKTASFVTWTTHKNVEETTKLFDMWEKQYSDNTYRWIVELKDSKEIIGVIDLVHNSVSNKVGEIGYCYGSKYWGQGYATEALKVVISYLINECDYYLVEAKHMESNPRSGRVMQKAGMKYETRLKARMLDKQNVRNDLLIYSIIKADLI